MIVIGEMSTGILVACVHHPRTGLLPQPFLDPTPKTHYRYKHSHKAPLQNGSSGRAPLRGPVSGISDERPFTALEEDDVELKAALKGGSGHQVHAGRAGEQESPDRHVDKDKIGVTKDLHVFKTPTND